MPAITDHNQGIPRPLICFIGTLRSLEITANSLKKNLIEPLNADVAFCVSRMSSEDENMITGLPQNKIVDCCIYEDANAGYEKLCDSISSARLGTLPPFPWRKTLSINGNWLGGLTAIPGSGMHLNYNYFKLHQRLKRPQIQLNKYTHFIVTRTDLEWLAPHPPLQLLNQRLAWIPEGEDYHGYNDRHVVCSARIIDQYLNFLDSLISGEAYSYLHPYKSLNHEYQLKLHLIHRGIRVGRFKNLAYVTGGSSTQTNWSGLKLKEIDGITYYCKYPGEVDSSVANSKALAEHRNPRLLVIKPRRLEASLPIWKARLRNLHPAVTRLLNPRRNGNTSPQSEPTVAHREQINPPQP
jgi:hypothetical protein